MRLSGGRICLAVPCAIGVGRERLERAAQLPMAIERRSKARMLNSHKLEISTSVESHQSKGLIATILLLEANPQ